MIRPRVRSHLVLALVGVVTLLAAVAWHTSSAEARGESRPPNGAWIAFSTAPWWKQNCCQRPLSGSDIFVVRPGHAPKLVAGRADGSVWNVCPAFSPDGKLLAFGRRSPNGASINVAAISPWGTVRKQWVARTTSKVPGRFASCPMWSANGRRLAYRDATDRVVVMTLHGTPRSHTTGDPIAKDFVRNVELPKSPPKVMHFVSPDGALVASEGGLGCRGLVVRRRDSSHERRLSDSCGFWIAGWSPDSRTLLLMSDLDGKHFALHAMPINAPDKVIRVVEGIEVNHGRFSHAGPWPGHGDVSWQPKP